MSEMEGQLPLFTVDGCDARTQSEYADEICRNPDCWCADAEERAKPQRQDVCAGAGCWCSPFKQGQS